MPRYLAIALTILCIVGCHSNPGVKEKSQQSVLPASVDETRMLHADQEPGNWMSYGRTYSEQRFSPLKQINDQNVGQLGLAWSVDLDIRRGQ
jgi:glucose dehydrogenase